MDTTVRGGAGLVVVSNEWSGLPWNFGNYFNLTHLNTWWSLIVRVVRLAGPSSSSLADHLLLRRDRVVFLRDLEGDNSDNPSPSVT